MWLTVGKDYWLTDSSSISIDSNGAYVMGGRKFKGELKIIL